MTLESETGSSPEEVEQLLYLCWLLQILEEGWGEGPWESLETMPESGPGGRQLDEGVFPVRFP